MTHILKCLWLQREITDNVLRRVHLVRVPARRQLVHKALAPLTQVDNLPNRADLEPDINAVHLDTPLRRLLVDNLRVLDLACLVNRLHALREVILVRP